MSAGRQPPAGRLVRLVRALASLEKYLLAFGLLGLTLVVFWGVVVRYTPIVAKIAWTEELTRLLLVWLVFLAAAMLEREGGHFSLDLFGRKLGRRQTLVMNTASDIFSLGIMVLIFWASIGVVRAAMGGRTPSLGWPTTISPMALVVGSALMIIFIGARLVLRFSKR